MIMVMGYFLRQMIYLFLSCIDYIYIGLFQTPRLKFQTPTLKFQTPRLKFQTPTLKIQTQTSKFSSCRKRQRDVAQTARYIQTIYPVIMSGTVWDTLRVIMVMGYFLRQMIYLFLSCIDYLRFIYIYIYICSRNRRRILGNNTRVHMKIFSLFLFTHYEFHWNDYKAWCMHTLTAILYRTLRTKSPHSHLI